MLTVCVPRWLLPAATETAHMNGLFLGLIRHRRAMESSQASQAKDRVMGTKQAKRPEIEEWANVEPFEVVAVAASAGGLTALSRVLSELPASFPVPILIVQHLDPRQRSLMVEILQTRTPLQVQQAEDKMTMEAGTVYIAPPDYHLLVDAGGTLALSHSELVHFVRPSADLLFESVAAHYRARAIAVVLTGTGRDGSMGVKAIKTMSGTVLAQDEESSEFFGMPGAAIETKSVDFILPLADIAPALVALVMKGNSQ
jgi:two-component system chemotaxis response regulator CheB